MKIYNILVLIFYKLFVFVFLFFNDHISLLLLKYVDFCSVMLPSVSIIVFDIVMRIVFVFSDNESDITEIIFGIFYIKSWSI
jgi:hypothetical protein